MAHEYILGVSREHATVRQHVPGCPLKEEIESVSTRVFSTVPRLEFPQNQTRTRMLPLGVLRQQQMRLLHDEEGERDVQYEEPGDDPHRSRRAFYAVHALPRIQDDRGLD